MDRPRSITTVGHGTATTVPDSAVVRLAAAHRDGSVAGALAGVDAAVATIVATARQHTEERYVASTGLSIWPAHDHEGRPAGFEARHSLAVRLPDLTAAGDLVAALATGVGERLQVEGVSPEVADPTAAQDAAREAAFADARRRAEHLAGLAGHRLGAVREISEGAAGPVQPHGDVRMMAAKAGTELAPGEQSVEASVTVTFALGD